MIKTGVYDPRGDCVCESCGVPFFAWIDVEMGFPVADFERFAERRLCRKCHFMSMRLAKAIQLKKDEENIVGVISDYMDKRADETQRELKRVFAFVVFLLFMFFIVAPFVIFNGHDEWRATRDAEVKTLIQ